MATIYLKVPLYLLDTFNECVSLQKNAMNIMIINFYFMKYNLPTKILVLPWMKLQWEYVCYHSFLRCLIMTSLSFCFFPSVFTMSLHCLKTVWCMKNFRPMNGKNKCLRMNIWLASWENGPKGQNFSLCVFTLIGFTNIFFIKTFEIFVFSMRFTFSIRIFVLYVLYTKKYLEVNMEFFHATSNT